MWVIYNILFAIVFTIMLPRFAWRMLRRGGYRRGFMQRLAVYDADTRRRLAEAPRVWIHAVSVGEMFVALRLMEELRARQPEAAFAVTTTTSTGHAIGRERLPARDVLLYFPLDAPPVMRRVLDAIRPRAIILTESEFWPNLIRLAHARGVPVLLVNGRISSASFRGYRKLRPFVARTLGALARMLVQTEEDRQRLMALGAPGERVQVAGTVKYDMAIGTGGTGGRARGWLREQGIPDDAPLIVGGSTWPGEEMALVRAWQGLRQEYPAVRLVLVPRHAERGGEVEQEIQGMGEAVVRRSRGGTALPARVGEATRPQGIQDDAAPGCPAGAAVLLADTTGELMGFYSCAAVVFVGKSLMHHGGQNFIEPAYLGKAVITGPHLENFSEVAQEFRAAGAFLQVADETELLATLRELLGNAETRAAIGARAQAHVASKSGAVLRMADEVERVVGKGSQAKDFGKMDARV